MNLTAILPQTLNRYPDKKAISCGSMRFSYHQFGNRVAKLANALINADVSKDCKVAVVLKNCHHYLECYFGIMHAGAVLIPLNHFLSGLEMAYILENSEAQLIIADVDFSKKIENIKQYLKKDISVLYTSKEYEDFIAKTSTIIPNVAVEDDDLAQIYYTSGTTGKAKGVVLSHKNIYLHAQRTISELHLTENDVWLHAAPLFHLADAWATWAITLSGGIHVLSPNFKPYNICNLIEKEQVTITNLVPTMYYRLVHYSDVSNYDYSSLRVLLSGGAPISPNLIKKIIKTFSCDYIQTYGLTETSPFLTMSILKNHLQKLPFIEQMKYKQTTGKPFSGVKLKVVNEKRTEVKPNGKDVGEIIVKGDTIFKGYWKLPKETKNAFVNGWFYTGDMAVINKEGYVTIVDRKQDMIITGGENVYSVEIENVLYTHPAVLEAVVIGVSDEEWGEKVKAIIVLKKGYKLTEKEIIGYCKQRIASYKTPKSVEFVDSIPKLGSGKISKKHLKIKYGK